MERRDVYTGMTDQHPDPRPLTPTRPSRRARGSLIALGVVVTLAARHTALVAQSEPARGRLSVRPREMAIGTRTTKAGEQALDSIPGGALVYVPQQCVGTRRCPLVVFLHGGGVTPADEVTMQGQLADKYGMILLAPSMTGAETVDAAMRQVLRNFAIDPDKIALAGGSVGAEDALSIGRRNLDVFSRIAPMQGVASVPDVGGGATTRGAQSAGPQFLMTAALGAGGGLMRLVLKHASMDRGHGYPVTLALGLYGHSKQLEEHDYLWRWLRDSWASPGAAAQPQTPAAPPLLTSDVLAKMAAFWTRFRTGPDSIRVTASAAHHTEVLIPVGADHMWVLGMVDMPALAAKYPSVAADLRDAGLTAEQEQAYRAALVSARANQIIKMPADLTPAVAKNVAFVTAHGAAAVALWELVGVPWAQIQTDEEGEDAGA